MKQIDIVTNKGSLSIKDVVVADPSIQFTIDIDPKVFKPSVDGIYLKNFQIQISISGLEADRPKELTNVGSITVNTLTQTSAYFYFTFGDARYKAGTLFTLYLLITAYDPTTGSPINFADNPTKFEVYGGGVPDVKS